ncbi:MAG: hypothetical protein A2Y97_14085 [Nitrospirae bacterium RBG_13_39_12]|nr:MAG: hypothetical protein A2Y97_14085 [Nitrospirae bacterium RBG_13_39_12]
MPTVSRDDEGFSWEQIKAEHSDLMDEKPDILFSREPMYATIDGGKIEVRGKYYKSLNIIILREFADIFDLVHEYRHVCGDDKWDKYHHFPLVEYDTSVFFVDDGFVLK